MVCVECKHVKFTALAFAVLFTYALAEITGSNLQIRFPASLTKKEGCTHKKANFGFPAYSGSISLQLIYADSDMCDSTAIKTSQGYPIQKYGWFHRKPWGSWGPFILLVDDGGMCTSVQKVRNAQHVGASGVIISPTASSSFNDLSSMVDDGSGGDVTIPSFYMMNQDDANSIKKELVANRVVIVEMSWSNLAIQKRVRYDLWTTPFDENISKFVKEFKTIATSFRGWTEFEPHEYIQDGKQALCIGNKECDTLCTNNGRYCAADLNNEFLGAAAVSESLRRKCIWLHYGGSDGLGEEWWNYVAVFADRCGTPETFSVACARNVYEQVGINEKIISQCMDDSGGLANDISNTILDHEIKAESNFGVTLFPSMFINGTPLREEVSSFTVCKALCATVWTGTEPEDCKQCMQTPEQILESMIPKLESMIPKNSDPVIKETAPDESFNRVPTTLLVISFLCTTLLVISFVAFGSISLWQHIHKHELEIAQTLPCAEICSVEQGWKKRSGRKTYGSVWTCDTSLTSREDKKASVSTSSSRVASPLFSEILFSSITDSSYQPINLVTDHESTPSLSSSWSRISPTGTSVLVDSETDNGDKSSELTILSSIKS